MPCGEERCKRVGSGSRSATWSSAESFKLDGRKLTLERRSELRRRWIEPAAFPALKEISLAEHRASKRRLRVECR